MIAVDPKPLTRSETALVQKLDLLTREQGYSPCIRELAAALGVGRSRCFSLLKSAQWKGHVQAATNVARSWRVVAPVVTAEPEVSLAKTRTRRKPATSTKGGDV